MSRRNLEFKMDYDILIFENIEIKERGVAYEHEIYKKDFSNF